MRERFKAKDPNAWMLRFHTQTSGVALTAQQPHNNIIRVTMQALAAALGGTQSLHTNSFDEAYALPSAEAVRIALRTQQIIAYESGTTDTVDPIAGSYYVEALTNEIEQQAADYIKKIDDMGGAVIAAEKGYMQREIVDSAYKHQREVESKKKTIVGVNEFAIDRKVPIKTLRVDPAVERKQIERLNTLKRTRDKQKVKLAIQKLRNATEKEENLMLPVLDAVKASATLEEICDALRDVYGEYKAPSIF
jgi:methylmalonyl-CoA mutase N-terminal domain/subunit